MKLKTKAKGISLIVLIVSITVFFILAAVSIMFAIDKEGILNNSALSRTKNLEKTAREQVDLSCSTIRLVIAEAASKDNSYSAIENSDIIQKQLLNLLNNDISHLDGAFSNGGSEAQRNQSEFIITYIGNDYRRAYGDATAEIVYNIELTQRTVQVANEKVVVRTNETNVDQNKIQQDKEILNKYKNIGKEIMILILMVSLILLVLIIAIIIFVMKQTDIQKGMVTAPNKLKEIVREKIKRTCKSIKIDKLNNNMSETEFQQLIQNMIVEKLNDNLKMESSKNKKENYTILNGIFESQNNSDSGAIVIEYTGDDYKELCNNETAKISYVIGIEENQFVLVKEDSTILGIKI